MGSKDDDASLPDLPFEETVGIVSLIQPSWWDQNPEALQEAVAVAEWLDAQVERRGVGPVIEERPQQRLTMSVEEAAIALGISRTFAYEAVARGDIPCIRIGRRILIPKVALEKLLGGATDT
jgi:excisionase family DNA binding protein